MIAAAESAQQLDQALREARVRYAGSMMEELERAGAERAHFLLASFERTADDA